MASTGRFYQVISSLPIVVQDAGASISYAPGQVFQALDSNASIRRLLEDQKIVISATEDGRVPTGYLVVVGPPGPAGPGSSPEPLTVILSTGNSTGGFDVVVSTGDDLVMGSGVGPSNVLWNGSGDIGSPTLSQRPDNIYAETSVVVGNTVTIGTAAVTGSGALSVTATGAALALVATGANTITLATNAATRLTVSPTQVAITNADLSCPGAGTDSERFGAGALAVGTAATSIGFGATAPAVNSVAVGRSAGASGLAAVADAEPLIALLKHVGRRHVVFYPGRNTHEDCEDAGAEACRLPLSERVPLRACLRRVPGARNGSRRANRPRDPRRADRPAGGA